MADQMKTCRFYFLYFFLIVVSIATKAFAATDSDDFEERLEKNIHRYEKMSEQEPEKVFERAKRLADHGQMTEALPLFEQLIRQEPGNRTYRVEAAALLGRFVDNQRPPKSEEEAKLWVQLLNRTIDWTENLPIDSLEQIWERGHWKSPNFWIYQRTQAQSNTPPYLEWPDDLQTLRHRYRDNWQECHEWVLNTLRNSGSKPEEDRKDLLENYLWFIT